MGLSVCCGCSIVTGLLAASEERVQVALEELLDLKGVWVELAKIWEQIDGLKEQLWLSIQPRKVWQNATLLFWLLSL